MDSFEEGPKTMHTAKKSPCLFSKVWDRVLPFYQNIVESRLHYLEELVFGLSVNRLMLHNIFGIKPSQL